MPDLDGLDMLREIKAVTPSPHVITITAFGSIDTAIRAVKLGAFDYITKPFDVDQLILSVQKALDERALRSEVARLRDEVTAHLPVGQHHRQVGGDAGGVRADPPAVGVVGVGADHGRVGNGQGAGREGDALQQPAARTAVRRAQLRRDPGHAARERAVRLQARRVHRRAERSRGHRSSRRTAARSSSTRSPSCRPRCRPSCCACCRKARFARSAPRAARRSTCGWWRPPTRNLEASLESGAFREDLFYRLNVIHIHLPALRDRAEDILPLAEHFLARGRHQGGQGDPRVSRIGEEGPARVRLAGKRARAGERRRAGGRAGRGAADPGRGAAAAAVRERRADATSIRTRWARRWRAG